MSIRMAHESARNLLNRNAPLVTMLSLVIMLITANNILGQLRTANAAPAIPAYFYDVSSDRLFVSTSQDLPPIAGPGTARPDEKTAVRAFVYACRDCNDTKDRFVAWVEAYTPDAQDARKAQLELWNKDLSEPLAKPIAQIHSYSKAVELGHMIARPDANDPTWKDKFVQYDSGAGRKLRANWAKNCGPAGPKQCFP